MESKVVERLVYKTIMTIDHDQPRDGLPQLLVADEHQGKGKARQPPGQKEVAHEKDFSNCIVLNEKYFSMRPTHQSGESGAS